MRKEQLLKEVVGWFWFFFMLSTFLFLMFYGVAPLCEASHKHQEVFRQTCHERGGVLMKDKLNGHVCYAKTGGVLGTELERF